MSDQPTKQPAQARPADSNELRSALRHISPTDFAQFATLWQHQHDADLQEALLAEQEQLDQEDAVDRARLAQLEGWLLDPASRPAELFATPPVGASLSSFQSSIVNRQLPRTYTHNRRTFLTTI